jgi:hypothetical protein
MDLGFCFTEFTGYQRRAATHGVRMAAEATLSRSLG